MIKISVPKPEWLKEKLIIDRSHLGEVKTVLRSLALHSVCEGAKCPNIGECFASKTATFMILGDTCTRGCRFCAVKKGTPSTIDEDEPLHIAEAVSKLGLKHVVITSVSRDDLVDGGAAHFARVVSVLKERCPDTTVELLIPDLEGNWEALEEIVAARPDVLNHNIETVPSLYERVRPGAIYKRSLELLKRVKEIDASVITKSGIMVGLGESVDELYSTMDDLLAVGCSMLTIGQYLQPSHAHLAVARYVTPDEFEVYRKNAIEKGFAFVAAGPLVRSSYHAAQGFSSLR
ncbi:MAG TPA: lipoyl synthase [Mesotoga infera]|nr:lipoyl synthase [Mesotoga infera]HPD38629.1 lipoyl synthase [Mesotoga infera]